jgi:phosphatidylglycerol:prolipoprotein diacylglycerol transferase
MRISATISASPPESWGNPLSIDRYGIYIGSLTIHFYALILMTGMLTAAWLTARRAKAHGLDSEHVWDGFVWVIALAIVGARLYHVLTPTPKSGLSFDYYMQNPLQIFAIWNGGLGIYGGLVGGAIGVWLYGRYYKQPLLKWFDMAVPGVALAQAIGRWGNFVNNELYGAPTDLPWGLYIPPEKRLPGYEQSDRFHPLFLYESLWNLASFAVLILIERRFRAQLRDGDLTLMYLMLYPIGRFLLDFVRLDNNGMGPLSTAQLVSLATCAISLGVLIFRHVRPVSAKADASVQSK